MKTDEKPHEPTPQEQAAVERFRERRKRERPAPRFEVTYADDVLHIADESEDSPYGHALLTDMLVTADAAFSTGILSQMANICVLRRSRTVNTIEAGQ